MIDLKIETDLAVRNLEAKVCSRGDRRRSYVDVEAFPNALPKGKKECQEEVSVVSEPSGVLLGDLSGFRSVDMLRLAFGSGVVSSLVLVELAPADVKEGHPQGSVQSQMRDESVERMLVRTKLLMLEYLKLEEVRCIGIGRPITGDRKRSAMCPICRVVFDQSEGGMAASIAQSWEIGSFSFVNRRIVVIFGQRLHDSLFFNLTGGIEHRRLHSVSTRRAQSALELWSRARLELISSVSTRIGPVRGSVSELFLGQRLTSRSKARADARRVYKTFRHYNELEKSRAEIDDKALTFLTMAIPNDLFNRVDSRKTAKELWDELEKQFQGTERSIQGKLNQAIGAYEGFKALEGETLADSYSQFNIILNDLRRNGMNKSTSEINFKFLKNLNPKWDHYSVNLQMNKKLAEKDLHDLYSILSQDEVKVKDIVMKQKSISDSLALLTGKSKSVISSTSKKKTHSKALVTEFSDSESETVEDDSSESDVDLKRVADKLALLSTSIHKRYGKKKFYSKPKFESYKRDKYKPKEYVQAADISELVPTVRAASTRPILRAGSHCQTGGGYFRAGSHCESCKYSSHSQIVLVRSSIAVSTLLSINLFFQLVLDQIHSLDQLTLPFSTLGLWHIVLQQTVLHPVVYVQKGAVTEAG
ncbi:hypothetical protein OSB04_024345 [Centaurea solstitialis]|uniref:Uncharacterized protein n=1 Tax=Centaurea solstitialis TaxID=347529 RepID=A0AA38STF6_9ASTR|nr:hypothetical protein OSB04_024345 [Centaurea solstitialis]